MLTSCSSNTDGTKSIDNGRKSPEISQDTPSFDLTKKNITTFKEQYANDVYEHQIGIKSGDFSGYSAEGGNIIAYYNDGSLLKSDITLFGESGKQIVTILFLGDRTYYIISLKEIYDVPDISLTKSMIDFNLGKYILSNDKLYSYDEIGKKLTLIKANDLDYSSIVNQVISNYE